MSFPAPLKITAEVVGYRAPLGVQRVAVMLNAHARRVTPSVLRAVAHALGQPSDVWLVRNELDARRAAKAVLDQRYDTVFLGGGDGTFAGFINELVTVADHDLSKPRPLPKIGVLKLGTGNSVATWLGASPPRDSRYSDDILRARTGAISHTRSISLLSVDGKLTPFVGLGVDGKVLNDFVWVKERLGKGPFGAVFSGAAGYATSSVFRTIPHYLARSASVQGEIINSSDQPAYLLSSAGDRVKTYGPGASIFRGDLMMVAAATVPYYGFSFKMFPFAERLNGMMQLRFGALPTTAIVGHLRQLWRGTWFPEGLHDVAATDVTVRFDAPMPMQVAGDAAGYRKEVRFQLSRRRFELLDFHPTLH